MADQSRYFEAMPSDLYDSLLRRARLLCGEDKGDGVAGDALQEVLFQLNKVKNRPVFENDRVFFRYIRRGITRHLSQYYQGLNRFTGAGLDPDALSDPEQLLPVELLARAENNIEETRAIVQSIADPERRKVALIFFEAHVSGKSPPAALELAEELGVGLSTAYKRIDDAKAAMKVAIAEWPPPRPAQGTEGAAT